METLIIVNFQKISNQIKSNSILDFIKQLERN